jgi:hypothetical protein
MGGGKHFGEDHTMRADFPDVGDSAIERDTRGRAVGRAGGEHAPTRTDKSLAHRYPADTGKQLRQFDLVSAEALETHNTPLALMTAFAAFLRLTQTMTVGGSSVT